MRSIWPEKAARWAGVKLWPGEKASAYSPPTVRPRMSTPKRPKASASTNLPPNTPMEPVRVVGWATIQSASELTQ